MVRPIDDISTGIRLNHILKLYLNRVEIYARLTTQGTTVEPVKPLNIIVITDGVPSDNVESVIIHAAKKLDACETQF
jgi:hypothetical protein